MPPAAVTLILTCLCSVWYHSFVLFASAEWVNITIDDTFGDNVNGQQFVYSPDDKWTTGQNCTGCLAHPNASEAFDHSWHDSSFFPEIESSAPSASVSFNGTAVYVYCIIFHSDFSPDGYTNLNFAIDGEMVGEPFISIPSNSTSIDYNRLVYANNSLSWSPHTLTITNGANGSQTSLALLDYIQYT
ncbi:uncharacterized protein LAESUDRAFT_653937 [Laetiporus sulphureus 93-53]|uniref:Uncharacterized protein n=1 Tax=Laetiporus sulphureus 93-53 TaxID=1314785 RepID=A0A165E4Q1_9APHY|nr:uncharacterized protein LAESUDRAFT_653937 [Laetiporus sulphureus 93-53]KZT06235.1 hypothetical protein LAESUDRAFT_653937 [Laetiporus sulphureus 93-53]